MFMRRECFNAQGERERRHIRKGFTLIEILVVIAIIAIVSGITVVNLRKSQKKTNLDRAADQILADIRETHNFALAGKTAGPPPNEHVPKRGYGIQFIKGESQYSVFANESDGWQYDDGTLVYAVPRFDESECAGSNCDALANTKDLASSQATRGFKILGIHVPESGGSGSRCSNNGNMEKAEIIFSVASEKMAVTAVRQGGSENTRQLLPLEHPFMSAPVGNQIQIIVGAVTDMDSCGSKTCKTIIIKGENEIITAYDGDGIGGRCDNGYYF